METRGHMRSSSESLDRLMADAHRRKFDLVVVWILIASRARLSHLLPALKTFQALGIEFVSLTEAWRLRRQRARWFPWCFAPSRSWNAP